jgi:hypothetical protein
MAAEIVGISPRKIDKKIPDVPMMTHPVSESFLGKHVFYRCETELPLKLWLHQQMF